MSISHGSVEMSISHALPSVEMSTSQSTLLADHVYEGLAVPSGVELV